MLRATCLIVLTGLSMAGCNSTGGPAEGRAVSAVVLDEGKRQEAAAAASATASSDDAMAEVEGPREQAPQPN